MIKSILKAFNQKPIVIYPVYVQLTGDHASAAALAQIMYWYGVAGGEFYKTDDELGKEICASRRQMERIKLILHGLAFLKIDVKGLPPKTFYDIDLDALGNTITCLSKKSNDKNHQTGDIKNHQTGDINLHQTSEIERSTLIYTESTPKITPENIYNNPEKQLVDNSKNPLELLSSYGIEGDLAEDFIQHRKNKKGVLSKTVLNSITKEAQLAGISTAEAVEMMLLRNWQGFDHTWLKDNKPAQNGRNRDFSTPAEYLGSDPFNSGHEKIIN